MDNTVDEAFVCNFVNNPFHTRISQVIAMQEVVYDILWTACREDESHVLISRAKGAAAALDILLKAAVPRCEERRVVEDLVAVYAKIAYADKKEIQWMMKLNMTTFWGGPNYTGITPEAITDFFDKRISPEQAIKCALNCEHPHTPTE